MEAPELRSRPSAQWWLQLRCPRSASRLSLFRPLNSLLVRPLTPLDWLMRLLDVWYTKLNALFYSVFCPSSLSTSSPTRTQLPLDQGLSRRRTNWKLSNSITIIRPHVLFCWFHRYPYLIEDKYINPFIEKSSIFTNRTYTRFNRTFV